MKKFITFAKNGCENSDKKIAVRTPIGTPIRNEPKVTTREQHIKGNIPNIPFEGAQFSPKIKLNIPISEMAGIPDATR